MSYGLSVQGNAGQFQIAEKTFGLQEIAGATASHTFRFGSSSLDWYYFDIATASVDELIAIQIPVATIRGLGGYPLPRIVPGPQFSTFRRFMIQDRDTAFGWAAPQLTYKRYKRGVTEATGYGLNVYGPGGLPAFSSLDTGVKFKAACNLSVPQNITWGQFTTSYASAAASDYLLIGTFGAFSNDFRLDTLGGTIAKAFQNFICIARNSDNTIETYRNEVSSAWLLGGGWAAQTTPISTLTGYNNWQNAFWATPGFSPIESLIAIA